VRLVLDSNVWLAALTTDGACRHLWRTVQHDSIVCVSAHILNEIEEKLHLKFGFHSRHAHLLTLFVARHCEAIKIISAVSICRDPADNSILATAQDGNCSHLITGDKDLLVLKCFENISIITPREFSELTSQI
jgi:putative PIN family toxin of toxin-antitoxin system